MLLQMFFAIGHLVPWFLLADFGMSGDPLMWDFSAQHPILQAGLERCDVPRVVLNASWRAAAVERCSKPRAAGDCLGLGADWSKRPWMFEGLTNNTRLQGRTGLTSKAEFLRRYGHREAVVSNPVAQSHGRKSMPLAAYVQSEMRPAENLSVAVAESSEAWYLCQSNFWEDLISEYDPPPLLGGRTGARSFGLGRSGSGLPFHWHGAAFFEVTQGQKRWFFAPPHYDFSDAWGMSSLSWLHSLWGRTSVSFHRDAEKVQRALLDGESSSSVPLPQGVWTCTQGPGEVLYIPAGWWHATLNVGETVFFLDFVQS
mmetsp:Transcript_60976/g.114972  ORF Transcript_60976/g.114972 Transcript_60976/m.114972 type:complete len:313 (+) Transcript_60976:101-1039(+)